MATIVESVIYPECKAYAVFCTSLKLVTRGFARRHRDMKQLIEYH